MAHGYIARLQTERYGVRIPPQPKFSSHTTNITTDTMNKPYKTKHIISHIIILITISTNQNVKVSITIHRKQSYIYYTHLVPTQYHRICWWQIQQVITNRPDKATRNSSHTGTWWIAESITQHSHSPAQIYKQNQTREACFIVHRNTIIRWV